MNESFLPVEPALHVREYHANLAAYQRELLEQLALLCVQRRVFFLSRPLSLSIFLANAVVDG